VEIAEGKAVTIRFDGKRCVHARQCVLGQPRVFKANTPGEWIFPDEASAEAVALVAHACPSGAITYERHDGGAQEAAPEVNVATVRENGPLAFRAPLTIGGAAAGHRATLCRCGASANKPFCDGSHATAGFTASGEPATKPSEPLAVRDGPLSIDPQPDGPLQVRGNLEITSGTGRTIARVTQTWLCRCGASADKPYCDGSHRRNGFKAP
jgi:CDGSH-type Zn-finger protein/uncharacterized Fe-S cluster protein YjdI